MYGRIRPSHNRNLAGDCHFRLVRKHDLQLPKNSAHLMASRIGLSLQLGTIRLALSSPPEVARFSWGGNANGFRQVCPTVGQSSFVFANLNVLQTILQLRCHMICMADSMAASSCVPYSPRQSATCKGGHLQNYVSRSRPCTLVCW